MKLQDISKYYKNKNKHIFQKTFESIEVCPLQNVLYHEMKKEFADNLYNDNYNTHSILHNEWSTNLNKPKISKSNNLMFKTDGSLMSLYLLGSLQCKDKIHELRIAHKNISDILHFLSPLKYYFYNKKEEAIPQLLKVIEFLDTMEIKQESNDLKQNVSSFVYNDIINLLNTINTTHYSEQHINKKKQDMLYAKQLLAILANLIKEKKIVHILSPMELQYDTRSFYRKAFDIKKADLFMIELTQERENLENTKIYKFFDSRESPIVDFLSHTKLNNFFILLLTIPLAIPGISMSLIHKKLEINKFKKLDNLINKKYNISCEDVNYMNLIDYINLADDELKKNIFSVVEKTIKTPTVEFFLKEGIIEIKPETNTYIQKSLIDSALPKNNKPIKTVNKI